MRLSIALFVPLVLVIALRFEHVITTPPEEALITGCEWFGEGTVHHLSDNNPGSAYAPPEGPNPHFFARCPGKYKLTAIQITAQDNWYNEMNGINQEFQIHTNDKFFHPARFDKNKGWKLCKGDAIFRKKGETLNFTCSPEPPIAEYVMISRESPEKNTSILGPYAAEIRFYGTRVGDSEMAPEPIDETPMEAFYEVKRRAVFGNITEFWYEPSYARFDINMTLEDVVLAWGWDRMMSVACDRGKGRIVAILGKRWLEEIDTASYLTGFKGNLLRYLGKGEQSKLVHADSNYGPGDVIVVMRNMTFDVEKVKNDVLQGNNGLLVAYVGSRENAQDNTAKLFDELGLIVKHDGRTLGDTQINPAEGIKSLAWVPVIYTLKYISESWQGMLTSPVPRDFALIDTSYVGDLTPEPYQTLLKKMLSKYRPYFEDRFPANTAPYRWEERTRQAWINYNLWSMTQFTDNGLRLPGTELFPGLVGPNEKPITHRVRLNMRRATWYNPTGVYVNPGSTIKWKVIDYTAPLDNILLLFNCHKDHTQDKQPWHRWPRHKHELALTTTEGSFVSPTGGPLFLHNQRRNMRITIELENVYRHPWFDLNNKSNVNDWENERKRYNGVPWMTFIGDTMHSCLQTKDFVKLNTEDMAFVTNYLDNVVKIINNFRGSNWKEEHVQVFATDVELGGGWGHSGVPIMGYLPWHEELTKIEQLKRESAVGITHELGHNFQNYAVTFKNGGEVSNNVYHFPVRKNLLNVSGYGPDALRGLDQERVDGIINAWKGTEYVGVNEGYYNWLGYIFGEGILVNLWHLGWYNRDQLQSEEDKVNFWLSHLCNMTEYNMIPWNELWKFPFNNETRAACAKYPCFFPDDFITQKVPELVERQLAKCNGPVDRTPKKQVESQWDILKDLNTQSEPWVEFL